MKDKLLNIVIVVLLVLLVYFFYMYWGAMEQPSEKNRIVGKSLDIPEESIDLEQEKIDNYNKRLSEVVKKVKSIDRRGDLEKEEDLMMKELEAPMMFTEKEIQHKAENVYEELIPEDYAIDMDIMDEALAFFDEQADVLEAQLIDQEEGMLLASAESFEILETLEEAEFSLPNPSEDEIENNDDSSVGEEDINNLMPMQTRSIEALIIENEEDENLMIEEEEEYEII